MAASDGSIDPLCARSYEDRSGVLDDVIQEINSILVEERTILCPSAAGASIFDIGCGSAEPISRYFIEKGYKVTGIDSSPALIGMCKSRFPDQEWIGPRPTILPASMFVSCRRVRSINTRG